MTLDSTGGVLMHINDAENPDDLLYANEGERIAAVFHHAWDNFICDHRVSGFDLLLAPAISYARRYRFMIWVYWLLGLILKRQGRVGGLR